MGNIHPYLKLTFFLIIISNLLLAQDPYQYNHPELEWKTFETDHYYVHFHQGTERTARLVGKIAEEIYDPITGLYNFRPSDKIHFIIKDTDDYSNGGAYFFNDKVEIWAQNLDYIMRGTKDWLRDVVTHEFAHMISIQKSIKFSKTVPYGFFQYFDYEPERRTDVVRGFPNTVISYPIASISIPVWFAEGVAQYQAEGARFDYRDPNREMILRDRVIHEELLTYDELGVFGKDSHGNESAYNLGFSFVNYLCSRFGDEVLERITEESGKISVLTFNAALENATKTDPDQLYLDWKKFLEEIYHQRLQVVNEHIVKGKAVEKEGFANLYPVWSADGRQIAYLSNKGSDTFGQNVLIVYDVATGEKKILTQSISSSVSWSPDNRYITFTRHVSDPWTGSDFQELFIYDIEKKQSRQLSQKMRAKNPDWSPDGKRIAFVAETNGLHQLYVMEINDLTSDSWQNYAVDKETGKLVSSDSSGQHFREVRIKGGSIRQLISFASGRQIYHPRWSVDQNRLIMDTATDYGRNIAAYDLKTNQFQILLSGKEELRYPVFSPDGDAFYYASAETGIYNIYRYNQKSGVKTLLTNVSGGAVMPSVNRLGQITYACYDSLGYHIYLMDDPQEINPQFAVYQPNYLSTIPDKNFDDQYLPEYQIESYSQKFTGIQVLPRLWIDYATFKPGLYLFSSDVLEKMSFIAGAAVNSKFDYDLYGIFEYREYFPTLFLEAYNLNQNITDTLGIRTGRDVEVIDQDINFDLTEIQAGVRFYLPKAIQWRFAYILSLYNAKLEWYDPFANDIFALRYRYLNGQAFQVRMQMDHIKYDRYSEINPSGGRFVQLKYTYEDNDFLVDFDTGKNIGLEVYQNYSFNKIELDWEEFFSNPLFANHTFSIRLQTGYIDRPVDDFFYLWAGGLIGMKGYSYFSIGGTKKLISTLTYRFPLLNHIDWQLFNLYFDKLYLGLFYDYGNAWSKDNIDLDDFKDDVGIQLRLDAFTNYLFPTKIFCEAVYPLDEVSNFNVTYKNKWRFYFGILFEFDFRERQNERGIRYRKLADF